MTRTTAILLAYNQADYLRDAVRDLLSQDAEGLEIILSDDCSADGSLAILEEEAERYRGPHGVVTNRTARNLGLNAHLNRLVEMAHGDIIIPFAGDDRFRSDRVRRLVEQMEGDRSWLAHSGAEFIGSDGEPVPPVHSGATFYRTTDVLTAARSNALFIGATAAWRRDLFTKYGPLPENAAYEDLVLGFRAALEDAVCFVPEPLISYRVGVGMSFGSQPTRAAYLARRGARLGSWRDVLVTRLADARTFGLASDHPVVVAIERELDEVTTRLAFLDGPRTFLRASATSPGRMARVLFSEMNRSRRGRP